PRLARRRLTRARAERRLAGAEAQLTQLLCGASHDRIDVRLIVATALELPAVAAQLPRLARRFETTGRLLVLAFTLGSVRGTVGAAARTASERLARRLVL